MDDLRDIVVLLTATVDPGDCPQLARRDPATRYADYQRALTTWLDAALPCPIVFCENSGFDLGELEAMCHRRANGTSPVEFLSFREPGTATHLGKGYGELGIVCHALGTSKFIENARRVLKVTGRFYIRNAGRLLAGLVKSPEVDVCCDLRLNLSLAETRVFCASRNFLSTYLLPRRPMVDEKHGIIVEHVMARAVHAALADGLRWSLMPVYPILTGVSGTEDQPIPETPEHVVTARTLRSVKAQVLAY